MKLLPNEETIVTSNENKVILTNNRIQMTEGTLGQSYTISMFLEDISSIEVKYKSYIILVVLAVLAILAAVYMYAQGKSEEMGVALITAAVLLIIWWYTRKHVISIASDGGSAMNFRVEGMGQEKVMDFIDNVSQAKLNRVNQLANLSIAI